MVGLGFAGGASCRGFDRDTMYSHGIATLALTEAYAMTRDELLRAAGRAGGQVHRQRPVRRRRLALQPRVGEPTAPAT